MRNLLSLSLIGSLTLLSSCARESQITCMFDLSGARSTVDEAAWRGAQLTREMPRPEWAGQRKLDWSRSESFMDFPDRLWPREVQAQEARWERAEFAAEPAPTTTEGLRLATWRDRGSQIVIGYSQPDFSARGITESSDAAQSNAAPSLVVRIIDPTSPTRGDHGAFFVSVADDAQAVAAAEHMMDHWGGRCAIAVDFQDQRMHALAQHLTHALQALGGSAVAVVDVRSGDFARSLQETIEAHTDIRSIYAAIGSDLVPSVLPRIREACPELPIMGCETLDVPATDIAINGATSEVYYSAQAWFGDDAAIESTRFASYYRMTYGQEPTAEAALAFDAANIALFAYVKALRSDPSERPSGAALAYEIESLVSFPGATGRISYRHGAVPMKDVWIVRVRDGKRSLANSVLADRRKAYRDSDLVSVPSDATESIEQSSPRSENE